MRKTGNLAKRIPHAYGWLIVRTRLYLTNVNFLPATAIRVRTVHREAAVHLPPWGSRENRDARIQHGRVEAVQNPMEVGVEQAHVEEMAAKVGTPDLEEPMVNQGRTE